MTSGQNCADHQEELRQTRHPAQIIINNNPKQKSEGCIGGHAAMPAGAPLPGCE
jgi:hypothetical protein